MNNEFEFQVYEDTKADCLKVFKTKLMDLVITDGMELIGKYMTEENGTSIKKGMAEAVKRSQKKRTVIHIFFMIENKDVNKVIEMTGSSIGIGIGVGVPYKESKIEKLLHFIFCNGCKRDLWFKLLEKTTLHYFILGIPFTINYVRMNNYSIVEFRKAFTEFAFGMRYKFLALLSWYAMYAAVVYSLYQYFFNR